MSESMDKNGFQLNIGKFTAAVKACPSMKLTGKVTQVIGLVIESSGPTVSVGELCYVTSHFSGVASIPAEVVGFREGYVMLMPIGEMQGIGPGCEVVSAQKTLKVKVGPELLGRVLHGFPVGTGTHDDADERLSVGTLGGGHGDPRFR
mgnify:CR=1 FL=1